VIVLDASVLSAGLGRRPRLVGREDPIVREVVRILGSTEPYFVPGIVAQEYLSGAQSFEQERFLDDLVAKIVIRPATAEEHRVAARISNECRWNGLAVGSADCLIAAQTLAASGFLFTLDKDFERMAPLCDLRLWKVGR
jgi:predicted nucleic acid-binding protein